MEFNYHKVCEDDAQWAKPILLGANRVSCEYAFANIYMWSHIYHTEIADDNGVLVARSKSPDEPDTSPYSYLFPVGNGDKAATVGKMLDEARKDKRTIQIFSVNEEDKAWLEENFKGVFKFEFSRDECDYVYSSEGLANLSGKKYQKKRNHVLRFLKENPNFSVEDITDDNIDEVRGFNNEWMRLYDNFEDEGKRKEHEAVDLVLKHYKKLGVKGCLIRTGGRIVAFSYGSPISDSVFCTHVEKALYDVNGAYNIINREFARRFCGGYKYINREDDVGSEGLRTAKLSYKPEFLEQKYIATLKGEKTECFV